MLVSHLSHRPAAPLALVVSCLVAAACGPSATPTADTRPQAAAPTPPTLRLPRAVLPTEYAARLAIDPSETSFSGHIEIRADVSAATDVIWLNAEGLTISSAQVRNAGASASVRNSDNTAAADAVAATALEVIAVEHDFVGLRAPASLAPGSIIVVIDYTGRLDDTDSYGVFRQQSGDDWYAFTQFEALGARRAFPCFDEPDNKVPWRFVLDIPAGATAVSNAPELSRRVEQRAGERAAERTIVTFAPTKPLPTYLLAFAVGPFEFVDAGTTRAGVPLRVVTPKGHAGEAAWPVESTLPLLNLIEDYFGTPYPYAKLDALAIPHTVSFGAMEHPGLITYSQRLLLSKPEELTYRGKRAYAYTAAHEMAHQWFGNLVTPVWWDDLWLNESFASWLENEIVAQWKPEWDTDVSVVEGKGWALDTDSLDTARKIHQPIATNDDILNAFDGITYGKGAAVLEMFETWLGPTRFRDGIRAFLAEHEWGNATSADFLAALGAATSAEVPAMFSTFLDQVGAPLVSVALSCADGHKPSLSLSQQRFLPLGSKAAANQTWAFPVCVRYAHAGGQSRQCTVMRERSMTMPLTEATSCPTWVLPNAGQVGYYRTRPTTPLRDALVSALSSLTRPERVGVADDIQALVGSGDIDVATRLGMAPLLARDDSHHVVIAAAGMASVSPEMIPDELRATYQRFVRDHFGARARALGWVSREGDDEPTKMLRSAVVPLVAIGARDRRLIDEARALAGRWLDDHTAVSPDMVSEVLRTATRFGDMALFERMRAAARSEDGIGPRRQLLSAMGGFADPDVARAAMALLLGDEFDIRESRNLLWGVLGQQETRELAYEFLVTHWDDLLAKLPEEAATSLVWVGAAQCDADRRDEIAAFLQARVPQLPGGPRVLAQALESMDLCITRWNRDRASVIAFLRDYRR